ncbi:hypothetical protein EJ02DRAFT_427425 [Clathrospora elynae]|uniref:Uncharacterized protein n=1 Tax=Clathrospora elynae TaxID=706981 RepID=A0A6A5SA74_9PLEO|nr:hypothetical protein EJ02DRAFT_427425 [Clathrospora elynae]
MAGDKDVTLSPREMEVLALAWQCMETQPKIDMRKLASLTGYTFGSASVTFGNIKRKIKLLGDSLSAIAPATPKKRGGSDLAKTTPKKRGAAAVNDTATTPSKRTRKVARQPSADDEEDDEEDFGFEAKSKGAVVKKEEEEEGVDGFDDGEPEGLQHGKPAGYGFLEGIGIFGDGAASSRGYRARFAENGM